MKKSVLFLFMLGATAVAQTPQYFNTNTVGGGNAFPLNNSATSRKVQWFIPANSLGAVPPGHQITHVYFQAASAATRTYPILTLKLKNGTGTGLTGAAAGPVESGMTTVYQGTNVVINSTLGGWIQIALATPWPYNPAVPLIVELEHNATTGTGPTISQAVNIPGPGNGRQWADYNAATITGVGANQVNFGIDVIPSTPCSSAPPSNTSLPVSFTTCPGIGNPVITLADSYTLGGITYQWFSSTLSAIGPYAPVTGYTAHTAPVPTLATTTWYQLVATCTNVSASTTLAASEIYVDNSTSTSTPPYYEGFEGVAMADRLPTCSWFSAELGSTAKTYLSAGANFLTPRSGAKFAAFSNTQPGTSIYYTHGLNLQPGITYSASLWYQTNLSGATNWTDLSMLIGTTQTTNGLTPIASTNGPAVSVVYKPLSGVFTVPTAGVYYLAISATGAAGAAPNLSWDDLAVEIPCSLNTPTVSILATSTDVCAGDQVILTATGADAFTWNNNAGTGNVVTIHPNNSAGYTATGTHTASGCKSAATVYINVKPKPELSVLANPATACAGEPLYLMATGALTYTWSTGANGAIVLDNPSVNKSYTVAGSNQYGCPGTAVLNVVVHPLPQISTIGPNMICVGDEVQLMANGATTYSWMANSIFIVDNPVMVKPKATINYTIQGVDDNGCVGATQKALVVEACVGMAEQFVHDTNIYPNPSTGHFYIEVAGDAGFSYEVSDLTGRLLLKGEGTAKAGFDLGNAPAGLYLVTIETGEQSATYRIAKD